ncbi:phytanoyl-CoA dioxygenase family protein [Novosphingobium naphthalenivorans]|uniref:phytanoyl-CoA dioxygenase family protein n=1 Tax=Novosphingobium naphthalenivorans TaxID=273168 RepID=UPI00082BFAF6|nr:phytanoyl-CoA dioxygenase family protein [Novosphingobium naphthalenivorans]
MALRHLPNTTSAEEIVRELQTEGYAIVDNLASSQVMDAIQEQMHRHVEESSFGRDNYLGKKTKRTGALIGRSPASHQLIEHPLVLDACAGLLHKASRFQLQLTQIISVYPGSPAQKLHQDETIWDFFPFPQDYHPQCSLLWAMSNYTEENGATRVVPGSQEQKGRNYSLEESLPAEMERGSALFYTGKVFHGAGENRSDGVRQALNITYAAGWLRQEENQYLTTPIDVARTLPDSLLKLMGYQMGCLGMGYVGNFEDPMITVRDPASVPPIDISLLQQSAAAGNAAVSDFLGDIAD